MNEVDFDSVPNDGESDDFATTSGLYSLLSGNITGTYGDDILFSGATDDTTKALAGNDIVMPGGGIDTITLGPGADQLIGTFDELNGDTITDLEQSDTVVFSDIHIRQENVSLSYGPPPKLQIKRGSGEINLGEIRALPSRIIYLKCKSCSDLTRRKLTWLRTKIF